MFGIVIVAHGGLAQEYLAAVEHVVGKLENVRTIAIHVGDDRNDKRGEISAAAENVDNGHGVVVVTDIFGGSPTNLAMMACASENRKILYGANLPLLIKLAKSRSKPISEAISAAREAGRKYINYCDGHIN